jgi:hypothetical protein
MNVDDGRQITVYCWTSGMLSLGTEGADTIGKDVQLEVRGKLSNFRTN